MPSLPSVEEAPTIRIPKLTKDPIWSLKAWPLTITVQNQDYTIPPMMAADWLPFLLPNPPEADLIVPMLLPEVEEVYAASDDLDVEDLLWLPLDILATVSGRPWWVTLRLCQVAAQNWDFVSAQMLFHNVHASQVPLAAWLDALLLITLENIKPENAEMFSLQLEAPPPDVEDDTPEPEMSAAQFLSMA